MNREAEAPSFRHEALFYSGWPEFVAGTVPFIRRGLASDEAILVVVSPEKIDLLRTALDRDADRVTYANMTEVGSNPARIIPLWQEFVTANVRRVSGVRGIGEPIWRDRSDDELAECQRHESLLNVVFESGPAWQLMCPYDVAQLAPQVVAEARCSHRHVLDQTGTSRSLEFRGVDACAAPFARPLPEPGSVALETSIDRLSLPAVRAQLARRATDAGLSRTETMHLVTAANEVASNSVIHGGGRGTLRMWADSHKVVCEIRGRGAIGDPLADRTRPGTDFAAARGLWLANQLCDLMQIRSFDNLTVVRLHMRLRPRARLSLVRDPGAGGAASLN